MKDVRVVSKFGYKFIAFTAVLLTFSLIFEIWIWFFTTLFLVTLFVYRNPEREILNLDKNAVLSPIDGKIISIEKYMHNSVECTKVVISKGILDVGVVRSICDMKLEEANLTHGLFLCSHMKQSAILNERLTLLCKNANYKFTLIITAGVLARKIHFSAFKDILAGRRLGFIADGKITLILPHKTRIIVSVKDQIKACDPIGFVEYKKS